MDEVWKNIEGFENYMVSNYGRIKDLNYGNRGKERILNTSVKVILKKANKRVCRNISIIVARTFMGDCPKGDLVVINVDGNKNNNKVDNLKVITKEECGKKYGEKSINLIGRDKLEKDFIDKFDALHGNEWEYVEGYYNSNSNVIIKCKVCGEGRKAYADRLTRKKLQSELTCFKCKAIKFTNDFNNKYKDEYEYIDREYSSDIFGKDTHIVRCLKCGKVNKWKGSTLYNEKFNCNHLTEEQINQRRLDNKIKKEINKILSELRNEIKQIEDRNNLFENELSKIKECEYCGKIFYAKDYNWYCSDECKSTMNKEKQKVRKRLREVKAKKNGKIEWNISLEKLIQRDEGICKICGRQVDTEDYYYTDEGYFIAGDNYPSIDHVIPLAKGGTHTWNNIQLAHRNCNSIKSDNIIEQEEKQLKWI